MPNRDKPSGQGSEDAPKISPKTLSEILPENLSELAPKTSSEIVAENPSGASPAAKNNLLASRRELLRLGAMGMPMLVSLKAAANPALVSQLRCLVTIPGGYVILIDRHGAVWVANLGWTWAPKLNSYLVGFIKYWASFVFPNGTAPSNFRPKGNCGNDDDDDDDDDDDECKSGDRKSQDFSSFSLEDSRHSDDDDDCDDDDDRDDDDHHRSSSGDRHSDHDDDDDDKHGNNKWDCKYRLIVVGRDDQFPVSDIISGSGNISATDLHGLYTLLAIRYAESGGHRHFPGISCIASVLDYLNRPHHS